MILTLPGTTGWANTNTNSNSNSSNVPPGSKTGSNPTAYVSPIPQVNGSLGNSVSQSLQLANAFANMFQRTSGQPNWNTVAGINSASFIDHDFTPVGPSPQPFSGGQQYIINGQIVDAQTAATVQQLSDLGQALEQNFMSMVNTGYSSLDNFLQTASEQTQMRQNADAFQDFARHQATAFDNLNNNLLKTGGPIASVKYLQELQDKLTKAVQQQIYTANSLLANLEVELFTIQNRLDGDKTRQYYYPTGINQEIQNLLDNNNVNRLGLKQLKQEVADDKKEIKACEDSDKWAGDGGGYCADGYVKDEETCQQKMADIQKKLCGTGDPQCLRHNGLTTFPKDYPAAPDPHNDKAKGLYDVQKELIDRMFEVSHQIYLLNANYLQGPWSKDVQRDFSEDFSKTWDPTLPKQSDKKAPAPTFNREVVVANMKKQLHEQWAKTDTSRPRPSGTNRSSDTKLLAMEAAPAKTGAMDAIAADLSKIWGAVTGTNKGGQILGGVQQVKNKEIQDRSKDFDSDAAYLQKYIASADAKKVTQEQLDKVEMAPYANRTSKKSAWRQTQDLLALRDQAKKLKQTLQDRMDEAKKFFADMTKNGGAGGVTRWVAALTCSQISSCDIDKQVQLITSPFLPDGTPNPHYIAPQNMAHAADAYFNLYPYGGVDALEAQLPEGAVGPMKAAGDSFIPYQVTQLIGQVSAEAALGGQQMDQLTSAQRAASEASQQFNLMPAPQFPGEEESPSELQAAAADLTDRIEGVPLPTPGNIKLAYSNWMSGNPLSTGMTTVKDDIDTIFSACSGLRLAGERLIVANGQLTLGNWFNDADMMEAGRESAVSFDIGLAQNKVWGPLYNAVVGNHPYDPSNPLQTVIDSFDFGGAQYDPNLGWYRTTADGGTQVMDPGWARVFGIQSGVISQHNLDGTSTANPHDLDAILTSLSPSNLNDQLKDSFRDANGNAGLGTYLAAAIPMLETTLDTGIGMYAFGTASRALTAFNTGLQGVGLTGAEAATLQGVISAYAAGADAAPVMAGEWMIGAAARQALMFNEYLLSPAIAWKFSNNVANDLVAIANNPGGSNQSLNALADLGGTALGMGGASAFGSAYGWLPEGAPRVVPQTLPDTLSTFAEATAKSSASLAAQAGGILLGGIGSDGAVLGFGLAYGGEQIYQHSGALVNDYNNQVNRDVALQVAFGVPPDDIAVVHVNPIEWLAGARTPTAERIGQIANDGTTLQDVLSRMAVSTDPADVRLLTQIQNGEAFTFDGVKRDTPEALRQAANDAAFQVFAQSEGGGSIPRLTPDQLTTLADGGEVRFSNGVTLHGDQITPELISKAQEAAKLVTGEPSVSEPAASASPRATLDDFIAATDGRSRATANGPDGKTLTLDDFIAATVERQAPVNGRDVVNTIIGADSEAQEALPATDGRQAVAPDLYAPAEVVKAEAGRVGGAPQMRSIEGVVQQLSAEQVIAEAAQSVAQSFGASEAPAASPPTGPEAAPQASPDVRARTSSLATDNPDHPAPATPQEGLSPDLRISNASGEVVETEAGRVGGVDQNGKQRLDQVVAQVSAEEAIRQAANPLEATAGAVVRAVDGAVEELLPVHAGSPEAETSGVPPVATTGRDVLPAVEEGLRQTEGTADEAIREQVDQKTQEPIKEQTIAESPAVADAVDAVKEAVGLPSAEDEASAKPVAEDASKAASDAAKVAIESPLDPAARLAEAASKEVVGENPATPEEQVAPEPTAKPEQSSGKETDVSKREASDENIPGEKAEEVSASKTAEPKEDELKKQDDSMKKTEGVGKDAASQNRGVYEKVRDFYQGLLKANKFSDLTIQDSVDRLVGDGKYKNKGAMEAIMEALKGYSLGIQAAVGMGKTMIVVGIIVARVKAGMAVNADLVLKVGEVAKYFGRKGGEIIKASRMSAADRAAGAVVLKYIDMIKGLGIQVHDMDALANDLREATHGNGDVDAALEVFVGAMSDKSGVRIWSSMALGHLETFSQDAKTSEVVGQALRDARADSSRIVLADEADPLLSDTVQFIQASGATAQGDAGRPRTTMVQTVMDKIGYDPASDTYGNGDASVVRATDYKSYLALRENTPVYCLYNGKVPLINGLARAIFAEAGLTDAGQAERIITGIETNRQYNHGEDQGQQVIAPISKDNGTIQVDRVLQDPLLATAISMARGLTESSRAQGLTLAEQALQTVRVSETSLSSSGGRMFVGDSQVVLLSGSLTSVIAAADAFGVKVVQFGDVKDVYNSGNGADFSASGTQPSKGPVNVLDRIQPFGGDSALEDMARAAVAEIIKPVYDVDEDGTAVLRRKVLISENSDLRDRVQAILTTEHADYLASIAPPGMALVRYDEKTVESDATDSEEQRAINSAPIVIGSMTRAGRGIDYGGNIDLFVDATGLRESDLVQALGRVERFGTQIFTRTVLVMDSDVGSAVSDAYQPGMREGLIDAGNSRRAISNQDGKVQDKLTDVDTRASGLSLISSKAEEDLTLGERLRVAAWSREMAASSEGMESNIVNLVKDTQGEQPLQEMVRDHPEGSVERTLLQNTVRSLLNNEFYVSRAMDIISGYRTGQTRMAEALKNVQTEMVRALNDLLGKSEGASADFVTRITKMRDDWQRPNLDNLNRSESQPTTDVRQSVAQAKTLPEAINAAMSHASELSPTVDGPRANTNTALLAKEMQSAMVTREIRPLTESEAARLSDLAARVIVNDPAAKNVEQWALLAGAPDAAAVNEILARGEEGHPATSSAGAEETAGLAESERPSRPQDLEGNPNHLVDGEPLSHITSVEETPAPEGRSDQKPAPVEGKLPVVPLNSMGLPARPAPSLSRFEQRIQDLSTYYSDYRQQTRGISGLKPFVRAVGYAINGSFFNFGATATARINAAVQAYSKASSPVVRQLALQNLEKWAVINPAAVEQALTASKVSGIVKAAGSRATEVTNQISNVQQIALNAPRSKVESGNGYKVVRTNVTRDGKTVPVIVLNITKLTSEAILKAISLSDFSAASGIEVNIQLPAGEGAEYAARAEAIRNIAAAANTGTASAAAVFVAKPGKDARRIPPQSEADGTYQLPVTDQSTTNSHPMPSTPVGTGVRTVTARISSLLSGNVSGPILDLANALKAVEQDETLQILKGRLPERNLERMQQAVDDSLSRVRQVASQIQRAAPYLKLPDTVGTLIADLAAAKDNQGVKAALVKYQTAVKDPILAKAKAVSAVQVPENARVVPLELAEDPKAAVNEKDIRAKVDAAVALPDSAARQPVQPVLLVTPKGIGPETLAIVNDQASLSEQKITVVSAEDYAAHTQAMKEALQQAHQLALDLVPSVLKPRASFAQTNPKWKSQAAFLGIYAAAGTAAAVFAAPLLAIPASAGFLMAGIGLPFMEPVASLAKGLFNHLRENMTSSEDAAAVAPEVFQTQSAPEALTPVSGASVSEGKPAVSPKVIEMMPARDPRRDQKVMAAGGAAAMFLAMMAHLQLSGAFQQVHQAIANLLPVHSVVTASAAPAATHVMQMGAVGGGVGALLLSMVVGTALYAYAKLHPDNKYVRRPLGFSDNATVEALTATLRSA